MNKELCYTIPDRPLEELWEEHDMYSRLRVMVKEKTPAKKEQYERLEALLNAEVQTNIAIIFQHHKAGTLKDFLCDFSGERGAGAMFPTELKKLKMQSKVCRLLADRNVPRLISLGLSELYHSMRVEVDKTKKPGCNSFLFSAYFWECYFGFYDIYAREDTEQ